MLFIFIGSNLMAQQSLSVRGKVTDAGGSPLIGVSITIGETGLGVITDIEGKFSLDVKAKTSKLKFSYIGFEDKIIDVRTGQTNLVVVLSESLELLDELVVIGYGTASKRNLTGSVSKVSMEETKDLPNTNFTQALRGRVAGVQFTDNGRPGQSGSFLIRGPRSLSASNSPLIILDGAYFNGAQVDINPNDIASIEVLKDASASAIYGSKAANGVILITTKKGKTGKPKINLNTFYGMSEWSKRPKLLSPERYIQKSIDVRKQNGVDVDPNDINTFLTISEAENYRSGNITNPYDMISQDASVISSDLSISGQNENTSYYMSASWLKEKGLIYNDNLKRTAFRLNLETKITHWLTVGVNSMFSENDLSGTKPNISLATRQSPFGTWFREDGSPTQYTVPEDEGVSQNPLRDAYLIDNKYVRNNLMGNFYAEVKIPKVDGLIYRVNYSHNYRWIRNYNATKQDKYLDSNNTSASKMNWKGNEWVIENILNYSFAIENHGFDATLLLGANKETQDRTTVESRQLESDLFGWNKLELGSIYLPASYASKVTGVSSMARLNYRLKNKYLFTFTVRRDGSSVFAKNNKYATFPSGALAWVISDEPFMKKVKYIDFLKIRTSYGVVGNQSISPYQSLSLASMNRYVYGDGGASSIGIHPSNISNKNLKWESTYSTNIALDFSFLKERISGTIEYYNLDTKDLLVERTLPIMGGYKSTWTNLGLVRNSGIELSLSTINIKAKDFQWTTDFVFSRNKNRIIHLYRTDADGDGVEDDDVGNRWFIGHPINVAYSYVFDGVYQEGDDIPAGFRVGDEKYKDLNGDGVTNDLSNDRAILGQTGQPKYRWGLTNTFTYKDFQLSFFINAMQGWVALKSQFYNSNANPLRPANMYDNGWWTEENKSNERSSLLSNSTVQTIDRSFIRLQDISLSYSIPKNILKKIGIDNLSIYLSGKNLVTFTGWLGTNPEDNTLYPLPRTFSLGLKFGF